ncbi:YbaN family protein [Aliiruegeria sabulilitoris]|uniref:YbaN family protein n=1 Tax=Aliiruegeria sabulilitoris TaxID=1510458 RepID=UPI0009EC3A07|nr:YbaN family protein [Aliiruegeria sabulilitoris]NDR57527.1 DUF454 domain-containing protein [Pseudoruegeria sp. M32A2M]
MKVLWLLAGGTSLALGILGAFLPLLPTVPFILLAAFCFSRSSQRLHDWLLDHALFGPTIADWRENGAISRRSKTLATISIILVLCLSIGIGFALWIVVVQAVILSAVLLFIWTRPTGSLKATDIGHQADPRNDSE